MNQYGPVPASVYRAAARIYIRDGSAEPDPGDAELVLGWAAARYPKTKPKALVECAFWALSLRFNYGIREGDNAP